MAYTYTYTCHKIQTRWVCNEYESPVIHVNEKQQREKKYKGITIWWFLDGRQWSGVKWSEAKWSGETVSEIPMKYVSRTLEMTSEFNSGESSLKLKFPSGFLIWYILNDADFIFWCFFHFPGVNMCRFLVPMAALEH